VSAFHLKTVSTAARLGLKGSDAATLLQQAGITAPSAPNRILTAPASVEGTTAHVRVLRLGNTEFILEQDQGDAAIERVRALTRNAGLRAHAVLRADCCLLIGGDALFERLSRVCAFDFAQLSAQPDMAVMTLLADISVTFALDGPQLRLWADPGFATYLSQTLESLSPDATSLGVHT
jgi:sarcosine oxidase gamma subunit